MKTKRDKSTIKFGASVLLRHVKALQQEVDGVREAQDIEYVHRMRVASRRLRTAFDLFPMCLPVKRRDEWLAQVKKITRALGAARDTDVQIERLEEFIPTLPVPGYAAGIRRLLLRLRQNRRASQVKVIKALDSLEKSKLLDQMENALAPRVPAEEDAAPPVYSLALYRLAYQSIHDQLEDFLSYQEIVHKPEEVEQLHAMRIAAKHLRYTLEAFAPLYPDELKPFLTVMRKTQEALGDIHDCDVWVQYLPQFLAEERERMLEYLGSTRSMGRIAAGIHYFEQDRKETREQIYAAFTTDWSGHSEQGVWEELAQTIQSPFAAAVEPAPLPDEPAPADPV